jgi:cytochrome oxidase Cu insertion factor (SCO1/SenC/PrrC family)
MRNGLIRKEDVWPVAALGFLLVATGVWWALALWPLPDAAPVWLERTRSVCFNTSETGLPDASGWILLVGQPLGMAAVLAVGWREDLVATLTHLASTSSGRVLAGIVLLLMATGLGAAGARVSSADAPEPSLAAGLGVPETYPRLDRRFPEVEGLVDQLGRPFSLGSLGGRGALVTFAFAHCETICPLVVRSSLGARDELADEMDLAVVALTLDPWRDTPSRLPAMAEQWAVTERDFVLSGPVRVVEAALDAWNVARVRDERTGDVTHPALVFLVEPDGTVAYGSTGDPSQLVELARRTKRPE